MKPFFFGSARKPLLGIYHPPGGGGALSRGVVLCYPMGAEYVRAHRAFRELTDHLVRRGIHVLRFDYYGTGDSAGRADEGTVEQWLDDIGTAVHELKATTGISAVSLVGLRFGATLAALHSERRRDLDRVVLWDPVVHGETHLAQLLAPLRGVTPAVALAGDAGARAWSGDRTFGPGVDPRPSPPGTVGVDGFPLTRPMRDAIAGIDLAGQRHFGARVLHLLVSQEQLHHFRLRDRWRALNLPFEYRFIANDDRWEAGPLPSPADLPRNLLQGVVDCFA